MKSLGFMFMTLAILGCSKMQSSVKPPADRFPEIQQKAVGSGAENTSCFSEGSSRILNDDGEEYYEHFWNEVNVKTDVLYFANGVELRASKGTFKFLDCPMGFAVGRCSVQIDVFRGDYESIANMRVTKVDDKIESYFEATSKFFARNESYKDSVGQVWEQSFTGRRVVKDEGSRRIVLVDDAGREYKNGEMTMEVIDNGSERTEVNTFKGPELAIDEGEWLVKYKSTRKISYSKPMN